MEEVSFVRPLSQAVSNTAKPPPVPSPVSKSGKSESSGKQGGRVSEEGVASTTSAGPSAPPPSLTEVSTVVEDINRRLDVAQNTLHFQIDDSSGEIKVQVVDKETGKVVRTIPPEPSLSLLASGNFSGLFSVQG